MDLGLNEFRLDLLEYVKNHDHLDKVLFGLHAVVKAIVMPRRERYLYWKIIMQI